MIIESHDFFGGLVGAEDDLHGVEEVDDVFLGVFLIDSDHIAQFLVSFYRFQYFLVKFLPLLISLLVNSLSLAQTVDSSGKQLYYFLRSGT